MPRACSRCRRSTAAPRALPSRPTRLRWSFICSHRPRRLRPPGRSFRRVATLPPGRIRRRNPDCRDRRNRRELQRHPLQSRLPGAWRPCLPPRLQRPQQHQRRSNLSCRRQYHQRNHFRSGRRATTLPVRRRRNPRRLPRGRRRPNLSPTPPGPVRTPRPQAATQLPAWRTRPLHFRSRKRASTPHTSAIPPLPTRASPVAAGRKDASCCGSGCSATGLRDRSKLRNAADTRGSTTRQWTQCDTGASSLRNGGTPKLTAG